MKKKNDPFSFRNEKKNILAILGDNKKILMPVVFTLAVILTVVIGITANKRTTEMATSVAEAEASVEYVVPENAEMEDNAYPEVNALIEKYYNASANGDVDTIAEIYKGLEDTELLKAVAASEYIEEYQNIDVKTKLGPVAGSYVAYVYNEVKLYNYDKAVPGLETFYICTDDSGNLYINGDIADSAEIEYLKEINLQADVIDLNNKVATSYNEMVNSDETLAEILMAMRSGLQVSVGEALASSEASTLASEDEMTAASEDASADEAGATSISASEVKTVCTIRATDVVNIRSSDSETADIISKTSKGEEFKQLEALANGWSKIEFNKGVAYVKTEFFEVVSTETVIEDEQVAESDTAPATNSKVSSSDTGKMQVSDTVRLRKSESTDSEILTKIYSGSTVNVIQQYANGWAKVEYKDKTGYIKSEYLTK